MNRPTPEALYRGAFDASPDGVLIADGDGRIVLANPAAAQLLGYAREALESMSVDDLVPEASRTRHASHRAAYAAAPRARPMGTDLPLRARRADGAEVLVEIALSPMAGPATPGWVVAAIRGIEDYPRVRRAIRRARYGEFVVAVGRLAVDSRDPQLVIERVPALALDALDVDSVAVFVLDADHGVFRVAGIAGIGAAEASGLRLPAAAATPIGHAATTGLPLLIADTAAERRFAVDAASLAEGMASGIVVPLSDQGRALGAIAAWSVRSRRFGDEDVGFVQTLANLVTASLQRAHTEAQLAHSQRLESVGQLTGGIAHDFNNLLTVIQGNLQILAEHPGVDADPVAAQMVAAASRAGQRAADLTGKLLAFSRRQALAPEAVDTGAMLHSLADMLRRTIGTQIRVEVDAAPACPRCLADPVQLESALLNVAINARDAMPSGGTLSLRCAADGGDRVRIVVQDSGHGMSDDVRARAFEPFFTTKDAGRGTGLGLSTVYGFVTQSRGTIELASAPGAGTTVTMRLPAVSSPAAGAAGADAGVALPPGLRVLVVEDDPGVRDVARAFLGALRCEATMCSTAADAMAQLDGRTPFDLLFTDIALGQGPDGIAVARHAARSRPALPVLLTSGDPRPQVEAVAAPWPLLRKPYTRTDLAAAILGARRTRAASG